MIYLPGSGIIAAYTASDGTISPELNQSLALYVWAWFIMTVIFTIAAIRSSWILFLDLAFLDITLLLLAVGFMTGNEKVSLAGYGIGYVVVILSCKLTSTSQILRHSQFDMICLVQIGLVALG